MNLKAKSLLKLARNMRKTTYRYQCPICKYTAREAHSVEVHMAVHDSDSEGGFDSDPDFNLDSELDSDLNSDLDKSEQSEAELPWECIYSQCALTFASANELRAHAKTHDKRNHDKEENNSNGSSSHPEETTEDEKSLPDTTFSEIIKKIEKVAGYRCPNCPVILESIQGIIKHLEVHENSLVPDTTSSPVHKELEFSEDHILEVINNSIPEICDSPTSTSVSNSSVHEVSQNPIVERAPDNPDGMHTDVTYPNTKNVDDGFNSDFSDKVPSEKKEREFECKKCRKKFSSRANKIKHMRRTHNKKGRAYKCTKCDHTAKFKWNLEKHMRLHEDDNPLRPWKCTQCSCSFMKETHLRTHINCLHLREVGTSRTVDWKFICGVCQESFLTKNEKIRHMRKIHLDHQRYKCSDCSYTSKYEHNVAKHVERVHSEQPFKCSQCNSSFKADGNLRAHENKCHGRIAGKTKYPCSICGKILQSRYNLKAHERSHFGERPAKCDLCPRSYSGNSYLYRHRAIAHGLKPKSGTPIFTSKSSQPIDSISVQKRVQIALPNGVSPPCSETVPATEKLSNTDMNGTKDSDPAQKKQSWVEIITDDGKKRYKCAVCEKLFRHKSRVAVHGVIHIMYNKPGESDDPNKKLPYIEVTVNKKRRYKCAKCGKLYLYKSLVMRHAVTHDNDGPKKYICSVCDKELKCRRNLIFHLRTHTGEKPYQCEHEQCLKRFSTKDQLREHYRVHSGLKKYSCLECKKSFAAKISLKRHMRVHTGEIPEEYPCPHCPKRFRYTSSLWYHIIRYHS